MPVARLERELAVTGALGKPEHLIGKPHALLAAVRSPRDHMAGAQRGCERRRIVAVARERQCLGGRCLPPLRRGVVGMLDRDPREDPRAQSRIGVADRVERLLERAE